MMYLALAYSANIGGTGTLIGTPPNLILLGFLNSAYPQHPINFGSWMAFALPEVCTLYCTSTLDHPSQAILNLALLWVVLQIYFRGWKSFTKLFRKYDF